MPAIISNLLELNYIIVLDDIRIILGAVEQKIFF